MVIKCPHLKWQAKFIPLSDGRPALRESCVGCGLTNGGTNLGVALPLINDTDINVSSYKYPNKTLGDIIEIDRDYIKWLILESKASSRIKKAAVRLYYNEGYISPTDGEIYDKKRCYDATRATLLIDKLKNS